MSMHIKKQNIYEKKMNIAYEYKNSLQMKVEKTLILIL